MMPEGIMANAPFVPHSYAHLQEAKVFKPGALPEPAYRKICEEYAALTDVTVSRILYDSDGLAVSGLFAQPQEVVTAGHPLLIYNRGGNKEFGKLTVLSVIRSMAPFARKGYLVFASNYRGNDGGEGEEEFGGSDVNDVMNLLEIARQHEGFDGKNAYMLGHSRGGMMTYMALRRSAKVNAAISLAGMADIWQSGKDRPEMEEKVYRHLIRSQGASREMDYKNRSALCWPEEIYVPLLLLHGSADEAVGVGHSERLAAALAAAGRTAELHIYPNGNHALVRYWEDVLARCLAWMERWRV
jgi:dipeptidyl aminopeptidase/acylaminoacyl peptidase